MNATEYPESEAEASRRRGGEPPLSREEAVRYIGAITSELREIARRADLDLLAYVLDMARMEAQERVKAERKAEAKARKES
ncbi:MAG: hypothetical protein ACFE0R_09910 [Salinarimonas sp.]